MKIFALLSRLREKLFHRNKRLFYINGAEALPKPLSPEEEAALLLRMEKEESVRSLLVEHNLRLVVYIAKKFESTGVGIEDLISIGTIGLVKAINTFRPEKSIKLATYASRCIENEILMFLRKGQNQHELSLEEPLTGDTDGNELLLSDVLSSEDDLVYKELESEEDRKILHAALASLDEREKMIISLRFGLIDGKEMTQKEVADLLGISQSYISRLEKKIIARLREEIGDKI